MLKQILKKQVNQFIPNLKSVSQNDQNEVELEEIKNK